MCSHSHSHSHIRRRYLGCQCTRSSPFGVQTSSYIPFVSSSMEDGFIAIISSFGNVATKPLRFIGGGVWCNVYHQSLVVFINIYNIYRVNIITTLSADLCVVDNKLLVQITFNGPKQLPAFCCFLSFRSCLVIFFHYLIDTSFMSLAVT